MSALSSQHPIHALSADSLPADNTPWLQTRRSEALQQFITHGFPKKNQEAWKYTSLAYLTPDILIPSAIPTKIPANLLCNNPVRDTSRVMCVDGHVDIAPELAPLLMPLSDVYDTPTSPHFKALQTLISADTPANRSTLTALNTAYTQGGFVLLVPKHHTLSKPIDIHYLQQASTCYTQLFIIMEEGSHGVLTEHFYGQDTTPRYQHHVERIQLAAQATLHHYRIQHMPLSCTHICTQDTHLGKDSSYSHVSLNIGGQIARHDVAAFLEGDHSRCDIQAITLAKGTQHLDSCFPIRHTTAHGYSNQHVRQILKDDAKGVFYGNVTIDKHCPKSEAHQLCHSVLLGKKAQALVRPELDILTDDVICSHGATVGAIDDQALYYLQSRGLNDEQATILLLEAFLQEMLDLIPHPGIQSVMQHHIHHWSTLP